MTSENAWQEGLPLDSPAMGGAVVGQRPIAPHSSAGRLHNRPLTRFAQREDSPSFYLSLSDLMSLLLVFFVMIFALTAPEAKLSPTIPTPKAKVVKSVVAPPVIPVAQEDPWPAPTPVPDAVRQGLAAVRGAGSIDPGLMNKGREGGGPVINRALLTLVASSQTPSVSLLPVAQTSLSQVLDQVNQSVGGQMQVNSLDDRLVISLPEAVTFDVGRAEIKPAMRQVLARLSEALQKHPDYLVIITGHTDNVPIHTELFASNWELSGARAAAVARALIDKGLMDSLVTIQGLADTVPKASNDTPANRQKNRRVEIELRRAT